MNILLHKVYQSTGLFTTRLNLVTYLYDAIFVLPVWCLQEDLLLFQKIFPSLFSLSLYVFRKKRWKFRLLVFTEAIKIIVSWTFYQWCIYIYMYIYIYYIYVYIYKCIYIYILYIYIYIYIYDTTIPLFLRFDLQF